VKEKVHNGKPVFEVMTVKGNAAKNDILRSRDRESDGWLSEAGKRAGFLEATPKGWVYSLSPPPCHVV
jgi:hypothetical protein